MSKKAQGLSLNTIVIAAIVILVLFVLIMVFTGRMGWFTDMFGSNTSRDCETDFPGAQWKSECDSETESRIIGVTDAKDHPGQACCQPREPDDDLLSTT